MQSAYPELEARLTELKESGLPYGYIGNIGIIGNEVHRYDNIMPETEIRYVELCTYLDSLGFPKNLLLNSSPNDHRDTFLTGIDEDKAERFNLRNLLSKDNWHFRLQPFLRIHLIRDPHASSTFFCIMLANYLYQEEEK